MKRIGFSKVGKAAVACALSALIAAAPVPAVAATADDLAAAQATLTELNAQTELLQYDYINSLAALRNTVAHIEALNAQIPQTQEQLEVAKARWAEVISSNYKSGTVTLLDVILGASSFDEMVNRIVYFNKVADHQQDLLQNVTDLWDQLNQEKADLETERANQELLVAQKAASLQEVQAAYSNAVNYYNGLSDEMKVQLAQAAVAAQQQAVLQSREGAQAAQQAVIEQAAQAYVPGVNVAVPEVAAADVPAVEVPQITQAVVSPELVDPTWAEDWAASVETSYDAGTGSVATPTGSVADFVNQAYSIIGSSYQWSGYSWSGDTGSSAFTCSGVVDYAMGNASQSSSPESLYSSVSNLTTNVDDLNYGDLVFYSYGDREVGHVAIYVGDGQVIDSIPNGGVAVRDVDYMDVVGGGSIY